MSVLFDGPSIFRPTASFFLCAKQRLDDAVKTVKLWLSVKIYGQREREREQRYPSLGRTNAAKDALVLVKDRLTDQHTSISAGRGYQRRTSFSRINTVS